MLNQLLIYFISKYVISVAVTNNIVFPIVHNRCVKPYNERHSVYVAWTFSSLNLCVSFSSSTYCAIFIVIASYTHFLLRKNLFVFLTSIVIWELIPCMKFPYLYLTTYTKIFLSVFACPLFPSVCVCVYAHTHTHTHTHIYIYIFNSPSPCKIKKIPSFASVSR